MSGIEENRSIVLYTERCTGKNETINIEWDLVWWSSGCFSNQGALTVKNRATIIGSFQTSSTATLTARKVEIFRTVDDTLKNIKQFLSGSIEGKTQEDALEIMEHLLYVPYKDIMSKIRDSSVSEKFVDLFLTYYPKNPNTRINLSKIFYKMAKEQGKWNFRNKLEKAISLLEKASEINPDDVKIKERINEYSLRIDEEDKRFGYRNQSFSTQKALTNEPTAFKDEDLPRIDVTWKAQPRAGLEKEGQFTLEGKIFYVECRTDQLVTISLRSNENRIQLQGDRLHMGFISGGVIKFETGNYNGEGPMKVYAAKKGNLKEVDIAKFFQFKIVSAAEIVAKLNA